MSTDNSTSKPLAKKPLAKTPLPKTPRKGLGRHLDELTGDYVRWKIQDNILTSELDIWADEEDELFDVVERTLRAFLEDLTDPV